MDFIQKEIDRSKKLKIKMLSATALIPERATANAAGFDCRADFKSVADIIAIPPGEQRLIGLGFAFEPPEGLAGLLLPRSGLGTKKGMVLANTVGLIDNDYRQEVLACVKNTSQMVLTIEHGERICQLVMVPVWMGEAVQVEELTSTERTGGFGSTGTK